MHLKRVSEYNLVFEWISYNKLSNVEEINKGDIATVYSVIWKGGPLKYDNDSEKYTRNSDKKVTLKCIYNSKNTIDEFLNEV